MSKINQFSIIFFLITAIYVNGQIMHTQIDHYLKEQNFSGCILITYNNKVLFKQSYGLASLELNVKCQLKHKFKIASITKTFTAIAIMQLHEKKLLSIFDALSKYVPNYPDGQNIQILHLLSHTSGIFDLVKLPNFLSISKLKITLPDEINTFKTKPTLFKPGEKFEFSNSNYILLTYIIEKVTNTCYCDYIKANIFEPANMLNSDLFNSENVIESLVNGYILDNQKLAKPEYLDCSWPRGAGGIYSTIDDLYNYIEALNSNKLLNSNTKKLMLTEIKDNHALGWIIGSINNMCYIGHTGFMSGFACQLAKFMDNDLNIIILSNLQNTDVQTINEKLTQIVLA